MLWTLPKFKPHSNTDLDRPASVSQVISRGGGGCANQLLNLFAKNCVKMKEFGQVGRP